MTILLALALTLVAQDSVKIDGDGTITLQSDGDKLTIGGVLDGDAVLEDDAKLEKRCDGKTPIRIAGSRNRIVLTGECSTVSIMGNHNKVTIARAKNVDLPGNDNDVRVEAAGAIRVPGNRNTVQWKEGLKEDAKPRISVLGKKNSVARDD